MVVLRVRSEIPRGEVGHISSYQHVGLAVTHLLAVVLATAGCGGHVAPGGALDPTASLKQNGTVDPAPVPAITALKCGQPFRSPGGRGLTLTGRFPATAPPGEQKVTGTVDVTSQEAIQGVTTRHADVFLVRDGHIATLSATQDLAGIRLDLGPGKVASLPGEAMLASCDPGGVHPGTYELYVRVVLIPDIEAGMESFGGPWPLEVT